MSERYILKSRDKALLSSASDLLRKVAAAETTTPAQMVTVAKLRHVLSVLPRVTTGVTASVSVCCPRNKFDDIVTYHWYDFAVDEGDLRLSASGHFYQPSSGGDTFTTMAWSAVPDEPAEFEDYRESLAIVPDVKSFPAGVECIDLAVEGYKVEILDNDNPLLDGEYDEEAEAEDGGVDLDNAPRDEEDGDLPGKETPRNWSLTPVDAAEEQLANLVDWDQIDAREHVYADGAMNCDRCACDLNLRGLYVDGRLRGDLMWSNMCVNCFGDVGEGIGWGNGQLYARQPEGQWLLVAGG